jgi:hypothetical protein
VTNAPQWSASFCYPKGLSAGVAAFPGRNFQLTMTPWMMQTISGIADNFLRQVMINKDTHVQKVPQWFGETIGFWDGTTLVTHTANIQGWTLTHSMFETSDKLETIETWKPALDASGKFIGLITKPSSMIPTLSCSGACLIPVCASRDARRSEPQVYLYRVCEQHSKHDGRPTQLTNADPRFVDYYGRPWAKNWKVFRGGWDKPEGELPRKFSTFSNRERNR